MDALPRLAQIEIMPQTAVGFVEPEAGAQSRGDVVRNAADLAVLHLAPIVDAEHELVSLVCCPVRFIVDVETRSSGQMAYQVLPPETKVRFRVPSLGRFQAVDDLSAEEYSVGELNAICEPQVPH